MIKSKMLRNFSCKEFPYCLLGQTNEISPSLLGVYSRILPFLTFGAISVIAAALGILMPDTRNQNIPDLISEVKPIRGYVPTCSICKKGKSFSFFTCLLFVSKLWLF